MDFFKHMPVFREDQPYNELPLLPPPIDLETPQVLKACIVAHQELAKLNMASRLIPNQTVLINSIPLLESQASSAIENIVTTTDELFQHAQDREESDSPAIKETLRYRTALFHGYQALEQRPFNISIVREICSIIRGVEVDIRKISGTTLINDRTGNKIYTPPNGEDLLRQLLSNWQFFWHRTDLDPLIKMAVQHYQFEAIHPFTDGNGRTGRILNLLLLVQEKLLDQPILYLSNYINQYKESYYTLLLNVTKKGQWIEWILYLLEAIRYTAAWTSARILSIRNLIEDVCQNVADKLPAIYSRELVDLLFIQPYVRIEDLTAQGMAERQTASKYLKSLVVIGLLDELKVGRKKLFINKQFLNLLKTK